MSAQEASTHGPGKGGFLSSVLDSLPTQVCVIDGRGLIVWVNRAWKDFAAENDGHPDKTWRQANYLDVCRSSATGEDRDGDKALSGIEAVVSGAEQEFYFEYPCHSPTEQRWFMMSIRPLISEGSGLFVITHQNITERKRAELRVEELAAIDGLTGIANRRHLDTFLENEWRRARRFGLSVSLVLFDIDFFKPYNDNYGHVAGDECLRRVGTTLGSASRRPGDLVARYGGEEFALVLGDTDATAALELSERARASVQALGIPHDFATRSGCVTVSAGVATRAPSSPNDTLALTLVEAADQCLYQAKRRGRNCVHVNRETPRAAAASRI